MTRSLAAVGGYVSALAYRQPRIAVGLGGLMALALLRTAGLAFHVAI